MSKSWYPIIDYFKCVGCMSCVNFCEHGVYHEQEGTPVVTYPNGCVSGCHGCEVQCPTEAISYYGDDGTLNIDYNYETYKPDLELPEGAIPKVAFVCTHNSCRSQMAEAIAKLKYSDKIEAFSAGTALKDHINPDAIRLIKEKYGIDMENNEHKNKLTAQIPNPDVVIFMGCDIVCPNVPSKYSENWNLSDPTGQSDEVFSKTIHSIEDRLSNLIEKLS